MRMVKLGEVCESISYGASVSATERQDGPRLLRITDLKTGGVDWRAVPGCKVSETAEKKARLNDGDLVIARTGGTVGKSFLIKDPPRAICASYLLRLRPKTDRVVPEYLEVFFGSEAYWMQLYKAAQGAAQPNVNSTVLGELILSLPLISDQRRIAAKLKEQLAEVDKARRAAETQLAELDNLTNAIIYDSLSCEKKETLLLGDVLTEVKQGIGDEWAKYPVYGATRAGLALAKEPPGKKPQRYKPVVPGTVFYNPMRILIGSIAFLEDETKPGITSPDYVALQGKEGVVDSRWFYYWLRSPLGEKCISSLARGAVRERMLFKRLAEGRIELPMFGNQKKASAALSQMKPMRESIETQLAEIKLLPQKILSSAFGEK